MPDVPHDFVAMAEFRTRLHRRWRKASLWLWLVSSALYAVWLGPLIGASDFARTAVFLPTGFWAPLGMALPSLALGLLVAIGTCVTQSWRQILRPTRARILGAIGFWLILPIGSVFVVPVSAGFLGLFFMQKILVDDYSAGVVAMPAWMLLPVSYVIACLLAIAYQKWRGRLLVWCLIWGGVAGICLAVGTVQMYHL